MIKKLKWVVYVGGLGSSVVRASERQPEGHGFDPHSGQLIYLTLIFDCVAGLCYSLSPSLIGINALTGKITKLLLNVAKSESRVSGCTEARSSPQQSDSELGLHYRTPTRTITLTYNECFHTVLLLCTSP